MTHLERPGMPPATRGQRVKYAFIAAAVLAFAAWCGVRFREDLSQIDMNRLWFAWPAIAGVTLLSLLNYALRVVRWRIYMRASGTPLRWSYASLTFLAGFAFTLSPGKVGEVARAHYYVPLGINLKTVAAAVLVERLIDLISLLLLAAVALHAAQSYGWVLLLALGLVCGLFLMVRQVNWSKIGDQTRTSTSSGKSRAVLGQVADTLRNAQALLTPRLLFLALSISLVAWAAEAIGLGLLVSAIDPSPVSMATSVVIYCTAVIAGALSFLPGGLGGTEAVMAALLHNQGVSIGNALLITMVCRVLTLWLAVALGWLAVLLLRHKQFHPL